MLDYNIYLLLKLGDKMRRGISIIICSIILLVLSFTYQFSHQNIQANSQLNVLNDGTKEKIIEVPSNEPNFELELPADAEIVKATMNLSLMNFDGNFPYNPTLIMGTSATGGTKLLWAYQTTGKGALGHQEFFSDGNTLGEVVYREGENTDNLMVNLPAAAEVYSAKLNFTGAVYDHWLDDIFELNREPDGAGDYEPEMIEFKNTLFTVYRSYDDMVTNGSDSDILINSTTDGVTWSGAVEITPQPDSNAPFDDSLKSADWRPTLEKFKNQLYCAWESNSSISTNDLDHDIILRSSNDGLTWSSNIIKISDSWENTYSNNPGLKNDWGADMVVFNNSLWLVWTTNNTDPISGFSESIGDIIISNSSDGTTWNNVTELTIGDQWYTNDFGPQLIVFNNSLYSIWVSNNTQYNNGDENDYDLIYCNTSNGINWSTPRALNPDDNNPMTKKGSLDSQPTLIVFDNKFFIAWASESSRYTNELDRDIVLGYTSDGNLSNLENVFEVTETSNVYTDHSPHLAVFNSRLYIVWVSDIEGNNEILIRNFELTPTNGKFGVVQQVNPEDTGGDDYRPRLLGFKNVLYSTWISNDPQTGTGQDRDIIIRGMLPSYLPVEFGMDAGGDGTWEVSQGTQLFEASTEFTFTDGLKNLMANDSWVDGNSTKIYGYKLCNIPLQIKFSGPGKIIADGLDIYYNCTFEVRDFHSHLNSFMNNNKNKVTKNGTIVVPFRLSADSIGKLKVSDIKILYNRRPTISITNIPIDGKRVTKPMVRIQWTDFDPDSDANISLYYDDDDFGEDGELIISNLSEDATENHYDWSWWNWGSSLRGGAVVYIYAEISDEINSFVNYSLGPLIIESININDFLNISILEPDGMDDTVWDTFEIQWMSYSPGETAKITLFYDNDTIDFDGFAIDLNNNGYFDSGDFINSTPNSGFGSHIWDISKLDTGKNYYVYVKITNQWNISFYNYSSGYITRAHMPAPREFTILDDLDPLDKNLTTHRINPRLSWIKPETEIDDNLEYVLKVWLGTDKTNSKIYEVTTLATTSTISKDLEFGQTYYAEIFAQTNDSRKSVKSSIIFSVINHAPETPLITITPAKPNTKDSLVCYILNESFDADLDTINYTYSWFKNDVQQFEYDNLINIPAVGTSKNERWECIVTPYDGIEFGAEASAEVQIKNSPPTISVLSPEPNKKYVDNKIIFFRFQVSDPDSIDAKNLTYNVNSNLLSTPIKSGYVPSAGGEVEFTSELSKGRHILKFNVSDGEASAEVELEINVKKHDTDEQDSFLLIGFVGIIIIIIILVLVFILLLFQIRRMRRGEGELELEETELEKIKATEPVDLEDQMADEELEE